MWTGSSLLGDAAEPTDGRWQRGTGARGLYLADQAATAAAIARWCRFLAELGLRPSRGIPHDHHVWRIDLELADLSTRERLARVRAWGAEASRRRWSHFPAVGGDRRPRA